MSALEDMMADMSSNRFLTDIEKFLSDTGMSASYFGKVAAGNSELVARLREGRRTWPETEKKVRAFMRERRKVAA